MSKRKLKLVGGRWAIRFALSAPSVRVAAWGRPPSEKVRRKLLASETQARAGGATWAYGTTAEGHPRHPLMLAYSTPLVSLVDGRPYP